MEDLLTVTGDEESVGPSELALDLISRKMYWTAQFKEKLQRANMDGSEVDDIVTSELLDEPHNIALH